MNMEHILTKKMRRLLTLFATFSTQFRKTIPLSTSATEPLSLWGLQVLSIVLSFALSISKISTKKRHLSLPEVPAPIPEYYLSPYPYYHYPPKDKLYHPNMIYHKNRVPYSYFPRNLSPFIICRVFSVSFV